ncbi:MAG: molecular chaperone TorD family protein [Candidatus Binatia bacterium]
MNTNITNQEVNDLDAAYCRAALYSALAIGFQAPTAENLARLLTAESRDALIDAASLLYPSGEPDLITVIETFPDFNQAYLTDVASHHRELFGHTVRGPIPPYETEYGNEALFQLPHELGDLMGFYNAFGLTLKPARGERADHISCECEFLMFLALKESYALEQQNQEMLAETQKAEKLFLRDHLGRFVPTFASQLRRHEDPGFYGLLGELCLRFIAAECARLHVPSGAANLGLRPADDDRVPMACGSGAECGAMPGACVPEEAESV